MQMLNLNLLLLDVNLRLLDMDVHNFLSAWICTRFIIGAWDIFTYSVVKQIFCLMVPLSPNRWSFYHSVT